MRQLDFARAALANLDAIYQHSLSEFGEVQAEHYAGMIDAAFRLLAEIPEAGAVVPNRVRIVRLLHQHMGPNRHL